MSRRVDFETVLKDKFFYFKAEEGGVAVATATDDNAEIRNLDARLFEKSTCRHTIAILVNNAFKTVQQSAKDKEDICRRADARQRYLTQDFTL